MRQAAGGVEARADLKAHLTGRRCLAGLDVGQLQDRAEAGVGVLAKTFEPVLDQDTVLAGERDDVGDGGDGD